jgi:hypothetical protein
MILTGLTGQAACEHAFDAIKKEAAIAQLARPRALKRLNLSFMSFSFLRERHLGRQSFVQKKAALT